MTIDNTKTSNIINTLGKKITEIADPSTNYQNKPRIYYQPTAEEK